jgi:hypothetical protein
MAFGVAWDIFPIPTLLSAWPFSQLQSACHDLFWEWRKRWCWGAREVKIRKCAKALDDFCFYIITAV